MVGSHCLLLAVAFIGSASSAIASRILGEDLLETGFTFIPISNAEDDAIEAEVAAALEEDSHVTVVGVSLVSLLCDSLEGAQDAQALRFAIDEDKSVVAEQDAYVTFNGGAFEDGMDRHIWSGTVTDPTQAEDEAEPRTLSMTWGSDCDPEIFVWKMVSHKKDGTTTVLKTVPCDAGGEVDICLAELSMTPLQESERRKTDINEKNGKVRSIARRSGTSGTSASTSDPSHRSRHLRARGLAEVDGKPMVTRSYRKLQLADCYTNIDVLYYYTDEAMIAMGHISSSQMTSAILGLVEETNIAMLHSGVALTLTVTAVGGISFESATDTDEALDALHDSDWIGDDRMEFEADLVQVIGVFDEDVCGRGDLYTGDDMDVFSIVMPACFENYSHVHEFGHNFGCWHNRDSIDPDDHTDYSHGHRYCEGTDPYRTVMSYPCDDPNGWVPRMNFFSNPDYVYEGKYTGTPDEDNARTIEDNMVSIANFRGPAVYEC